MSLKIDLHCHSTHSDGTWTVSDLLRVAAKQNIQGLSITDHDTLAGSLEAQHQSHLFKGVLIPGIEVSTTVQNTIVHLLAFFPDISDIESSSLSKSLTLIQDDRINRMRKMVTNVQATGMNVTFDEVITEAKKGINNLGLAKKSIGRPHLARVLKTKGYVKSVKEAFELYLADDKPCYVPRYTLTFTEWIKEIKAIDGVLIWAHPLYGHQKDMEKLKLIANDFLSHKIDGFELVYDYRDDELTKQFVNQGTKFLMNMKESENLLTTAGSDFHGDRGNLGSVSLDVDDWENFLDVLKYS